MQTSEFIATATLHQSRVDAYSNRMPRPKRIDHSGEIYHVLNRGNAKQIIFRKSKDYEAFESILIDGIGRFSCDLYSYQLMPNHWHFVLSPRVNGEMSQLLRWITVTHSMRYHAHYQTSGQGHVYQGRFKSFPVENDEHFLRVCRYVERNALRAGLVERAEDWRFGSLHRRVHRRSRDAEFLSPWPVTEPSDWVAGVNGHDAESELSRIRKSVVRGCPYGGTEWVKAATERLDLHSTLRSRGRPRAK